MGRRKCGTALQSKQNVKSVGSFNIKPVINTGLFPGMTIWLIADLILEMHVLFDNAANLFIIQKILSSKFVLIAEIRIDV